MLFSLSTGHEIGLAATGAAFIIFSLVSSFVLPARNPNFPGRGRNWYLALCVCFFAAMISAVIVFGREKPEASAASTSTTSSSSSSGGQYTGGSATAGATLFKSQPCASCHTFKPAGATGKVGPDLDNLPQYAQKAGVPLTTFVGNAISNPPAKYVPPGFPTNAMPKLPLTPQQVDDLVAYLTSAK